MSITRLWTSLLALLIAAAPVLAQEFPMARERKLWPGLVGAILLTLCVMVASMVSSKRGHQD